MALMAVEGSPQSRRRAVGRAIVPRIVFVQDDFRNGQLGWQAAFADYSPLSAPSMELDAGIRPLPLELSTPGTAFFIAGHNRSDDLFMFLTKKLTQADGIVPNQQYQVSFRIDFASNAGSNCVGIGGAPGESVTLKTGATGREPQVTLDAANHFRVNVDKGNQSQGGTEASVAGNIANGTSNCSGDAPFVSITRSHTHTHTVQANGFGEIWLIVGTDSGFEGLTRLYYQRIEATVKLP